jgi:hypothetical protein
MNKVNWTAVAVFGGVALLVVLIGVSLLGSYGGYSGWGAGGRMMGPGMMGGWGFGPFGWLGMIFMWLLPLGFLALLVLGIIWLVKTVTQPGGRLAASSRTCSNCGRPVQADWRVCPHCGQELTS